MKARLVFEDGTVFYGNVFAMADDRYGEVIFNTALSGYQEVLTDPSYSGQIVLMTYPLIGSYGINEQDIESGSVFLRAFLVKEYINFPSNWRSKKSLKKYLEENNILGVEGFDTRAITRFIRDKGSQKALLTTSEEDISVLIQKVASSQGMKGQNLVQHVTCSEQYDWEKPQEEEFRVAVIDCGVKYNILRQMTTNHCFCTVFPAGTSAEDILSGKFDGVFISNGPGDPEPVNNVVQTIKALIGKIPVFGICLGNQLLALALGGRTFKLAFGHHGANHPVKNLETGKVEITSQNHGFGVDLESLSMDDVEVTHINLNDNTVEGFKHKKYPAFSVQYHPEAAPGPNDSRYLFKNFIDLMRQHRKKKIY
ncbi:MAG: glutamine-hydrolyzing carbamoyl-phosphate synthase small subunit [bacterium]|nr:glutamine-hydrolyzing carbamoyl-phosphate synthase small subunit [bacterium]